MQSLNLDARPASSPGNIGAYSVPHLQQISGVAQNEMYTGEIAENRYLLRRGNYDIHLADSARLCKEAGALVKRMYSWRGYHTEHISISSQNHHQLTLEASLRKNPVGTLTVGLDSNKGMLLDELYEREIQPFRDKKRKLCELSKLAIDPLHSSTKLLASLINLAYIYARTLHRADDAFIEVNPRHASYYRRMLGFHQIGEERVCERVDAPAVLMHLKLDYMDEQISRLAGSAALITERSLYPHFLPKPEQENVANNLSRYINFN